MGAIVKYFQIIIKLVNGFLYKPKGLYMETLDFLKKTGNNNEILLVHSSYEIKRSEAKSYLNKPHHLFKVPARGLTVESPVTRVINLKEVRVVGQEGSVISSDNKLLADISIQIGSNHGGHSIFKKKLYTRLNRLEESVLLLSASGASSNYFHWMFDLLPQIEILNKAGYNFDSFSKILISGKPLGFQKDSLSIFDIPKNKICWLNNDSHYLVKMLTVSSLPGLSGNIPHWVVDYLTKVFKPYFRRIDGLPKKIWIDRSDAKNFRDIDNFEPDKYYGFKAYTKVRLAELTLQEQMDYFYNADEVAGTHGAGFTNLLFCRQGTKVVEIFQSNYINQCYWTLASHNKLNYYYHIL